jgi:molybdopterin/thiamine biosynthesis adenylyltransferase
MSSTLEITRMDASQSAAEAELNALIAARAPKYVMDTLDEQLGELFFSRFPALRRAPDGLQKQTAFVASYLPSAALARRFGEWVYFPQIDHLIHYLPEAMHTELRTARNRELVSTEEQARLYGSRIAVAGLSLGNAAALTLCISGIGREFRLADADTISGTNLNRIRRGFSALGSKKTSVAAHEILEINPYAELELFSEGLGDHNLEAFLLGPQPVHVLVDEVDDAYMKIQLRRVARAHRIAVVAALDLHDTVFLDVERFDLYPDQPLFHGALSEAELDRIPPHAPARTFVAMVQRWVGTELDPRLVDSMGRVLEGRLAGWPQLAPTAFAAGSAVACAVKRILLGQATQGRRCIAL